MFIVEKSCYGGIDWHDSRTHLSQILNQNNEHLHASHSAALKAVINDIILMYPDFYNDIMNAFQSGQIFVAPMKLDNGQDCEIIVEKDKVFYERDITINPNELSIHVSYLFGQVEFVTNYSIREVNCPKYFVIENFLATAKGVPSVERIYHIPFDTLEQANEYKSGLKPHSDLCPSEIGIFCNDVSSLNQEWLLLQYKIIKLIEITGASWYDNSFSIFMKKHIENLSALM